MVDRQINHTSAAASPEKEKKGAKKDEKEKPDSPKTEASKRAKKEVEQNPFKKLIDLSDLIDFEQNPQEVEKDC